MLGSNCLKKSDFFGTLGHGNPHDIHNANAALIGGAFLTSLYYFLNIGANSTSAATAKVNLSISSSTGTYPIVQTNMATAILRTGSASQKISGYSLVFESTGPIVFSEISAPVAIGGGYIQATQIRKQVTPQRIQINYTFVGPTSSLSQAVSMKIYYCGAFKASGKVSLNRANSTVVGNISNNKYVKGKLGTGSYSFTAL